MAQEAHSPDAILALTNLTPNTLTHITDNPDSPDTNWLVLETVNSTDCRVSFPTPTGTPQTGAGLQEFRVLVRRSANGGTTPTATIHLYENGNLLASGTATDVTSTTGQVLAFTWNASSLTVANGSGVECRMQGTAAGSSGNRRTVELGAIRWNADVTLPVSATRAAVFSANQQLRPTRMAVLSASQQLRPTRIVSVEAKGMAVRALPVVTSTSQPVSQQRVAVLSSIGSLQALGQAVDEALGGIMALGSSPQEARGTLVQTGTGAIEALQALAVLAAVVAEAGARLLGETPLPAEAGGTVREDRPLPFGAAGTIGETQAIPFAPAQALATLAESIVEGGAALAGTVAGPFGTAAELAASGGISAEGLAAVQRVLVAELEAEGLVRSVASLVIEAVSPLLVGFGIVPLGTEGPVVTTQALAVASAATVAHPEAMPLAAGASVASHRLMPAETVAQLAALATTLSEALGPLAALASLGTEAPGAAARSRALPFEAFQFILPVIVAFAEFVHEAVTVASAATETVPQGALTDERLRHARFIDEILAHA